MSKNLNVKMLGVATARGTSGAIKPIDEGPAADNIKIKKKNEEKMKKKKDKKEKKKRGSDGSSSSS